MMWYFSLLRSLKSHPFHSETPTSALSIAPLHPINLGGSQQLLQGPDGSMIYTPPKTNGSSLFRILQKLTAGSPKMRVLVQMMFLFNGVIFRFKMWNFMGCRWWFGGCGFLYCLHIWLLRSPPKECNRKIPCWALSKNYNSVLGNGHLAPSMN